MDAFRKALFAAMRKQNTASLFSARWREMTKWQHERRTPL